MSTTCTRTPGATSSSSQASWRAFEQENVRDVGEVPPEQLSEVVKVWARDAREVSYDMEDIVDTFLVRVQDPANKLPSKRSAKKFIKKMVGFVTKAKARHDIGQEIKDIKERVKEIAERRDR
jgi:disease resistance protein RPM1